MSDEYQKIIADDEAWNALILLFEKGYTPKEVCEGMKYLVKNALVEAFFPRNKA